MKSIFITGASSSIGRAIAVAFARPGSLLILSGRNKARLLGTLEAVERKGAKGLIIPADLSHLGGINKLIVAVRAEVSAVDVLVHAAGIWHDEHKVLAHTEYQKFPQQVVLDTYMVGLVAPALLVHGLLPIMPTGSNILTISGTFESGAKGWLSYYGSKRGLEDLSEGLSQELQDKGIQVHCISPSDTATDAYKKYFPQHVVDSVSPEAVAEQAVRLCSRPAKGVVWVVKKGQPPRPGFHQ